MTKTQALTDFHQLTFFKVSHVVRSNLTSKTRIDASTRSKLRGFVKKKYGFDQQGWGFRQNSGMIFPLKWFVPIAVLVDQRVNMSTAMLE